MKKIISLVLVLSVLFSLSALPSFAAEVDRDGAIAALDMLQTLEIMQFEYNTNNINVDQKITRAEFAVYFAKLMNVNESTNGTLYYNDVPKTYYAYGAITAMTENGYLSGVENKEYAPDQVILKEHAISAILKAMGYGPLMGYKDGLRSALRKTELDVGVSNNTDLVLGDLILILKNALIANCFEVNEISNDGNKYYEGGTLLYNTRRMDYVEDQRMTGANSASINDESLDGDEFVVGGVKYKSDLSGLSDSLGYSVNMIYYQPSENSDKKIIWLERLETNDELHIFVDEYAEYTSANSTLTYYDKNDKKKSVIIPQGISVVYNGGFTAEDLTDIFSADKYELTLINTDDKGGYDAAIVWRYENRFVNLVDKDTMMMFDRITQTGVSVYEDDYTYFEITNSAGEKVSPFDITPKSIVSTYISKDGSFFKGVISTETVNGPYSGYDEDRGLEVDGKRYKFYNSTGQNDYSGAKSITLYLDSNGYIAYAESNYSSDNMVVAYAFKGNCEDRGLSYAMNLKVLKEDGEIAQYVIEDSVFIDGVRYTEPEKAYAKIQKNEDGSFKPQIMCFTTNKDGKITRIDLSDDNGGSGKVIMKNASQPLTGTNHYKDTMNIIGMNMLVNSGTKIFYVPTDDEVATALDRNFYIQTPVDAQDFSGAISYKITPDEVFYEQYIVRKGALTQTSYSDYKGFFLVEDVFEKINQDDETVMALTGMQMGQKLTLEIDPDIFDLFADENLKNVKSGDILRVAHKDNVLGNARMIYSYGQTAPVSENRDDPVHNARFISGYVHSKDGNVFKLDFENDGQWEQIADMSSYSGNIMVYDSKARDEKVRKGTVSDMTTAVDSGVGSFVVMHTYYMRCWGLVIYK